MRERAISITLDSGASGQGRKGCQGHKAETLSAEQGLDTDEAVDLAADLLLCAAQTRRSP